MVEAPGAVETATAYGSRPRRGNPAPERVETWLRGNVRPVAGVGAVVCGGLVVALGAAAAGGAGPDAVRRLGLVTAAAVVAVVALGVVAGGRRLGRRGDALVVRLSPWRTAEVPLAVVECVFPGSQPMTGPVIEDVHGTGPAADGPAPTRRVGTLVIRFAERAREWREGPAFAPWGTWHDGHVIVDGRWCEPLSAERARAISQRLLEAKREAAGEPPR